MTINSAVISASAALMFLAFAPDGMADTLIGTDGPDHLVGGTSASELKGLAGDDVLFGDPVAGIGPARAMKRVSVGSNGQEGFGNSERPSVTADGRMMVFVSTANFLPSGTNNEVAQVYSKDLLTGAVTLISSDMNGAPLTTPADSPAISPDGKYVAFLADATNLSADFTLPPAGPYQLILKNLETGKYTLVSREPNNGFPGSDNSLNPVFSPDSSMLSFESYSSNLDAADTKNVRDVFIALVSSPNPVYRASTGKDGELAMGGRRLVFTGVFP